MTGLKRVQYGNRCRQPDRMKMKLPPEQQSTLLSTPEGRERVHRAGIARALATPIARELARLVAHLSPQERRVLREGQQLSFSADPQPGELPLPAATVRIFRASPPTRFAPGVQLHFADPEDEDRLRQQDKMRQERWSAASGFRVIVRLDTNRQRMADGLSLVAAAAALRS